MNIGACGLLCILCRNFVNGQCEGCVRGDMCSAQMAVSSPCAVLRCAAARRIAYCSHDCSEFPCALIQAHPPYCWLSPQPPHPCANPLAARWPGYHSKTGGDQLDHDGLRVYCLGSFRVFRDGTEILDEDWGQSKGPTRKIKAMFAYLLFRGQHGARKETLMDLLWPEQNDCAKASDSFHQALHCLRLALEPDLAHGEASSYIAYQGGRYRLCPLKPVWIDVAAFEACCNNARQCFKAGAHEESMLHWAQALDLYRGDYLADIDVEYTENRECDWCLPKRVLLRRLYQTAMLQVAPVN